MPSHNDSVQLGLVALGVLLALVCLGFALRAGRRRRLIDNLPTSKTTGVFMGLVELKGTAEAEQPLVSYLAEVPCVHYAWGVQERWSRTVTETYTDNQGKTRTRTRHESGWTSVGGGGESIPFYLQDDCGVIRILPEHALIEPRAVFNHTCGTYDPLYYGKGPRTAVTNSDHVRQFHEVAIPLHADTYVVGTARERVDIVAPEIAHAAYEAMFLISTRTERQVARGLGIQYWVLGFLGLVLCVGAWIVRDQVMTVRGQPEIMRYIVAAVAYVAAWLLGWGWMVYNSLVDLRQRVRQAWANVDVQLKRRNDLIPNLVRTVESLRDYERTVQTELALLRTQLQATAPGQPGPDPAGCARHLTIIVEKYPELRANETFMGLQKNLIDTEQRIALARGYFNDIATFYNTRLEIVPDRFVAALAALKPQPLIAATDFERAPVSVEFPQRMDGTATAPASPRPI